MNLLSRLVHLLVHSTESAHQFLPIALTLFRRSLRLPHLRNHQLHFPHHAIEICIVSHLSKLSLRAVYDAYISVANEHQFSHLSSLSAPHLARVWKEGWEPAIKMLQPPLKPCAKTSETVDTQLFAHYFIYFVPSIRFSEKRARLLLMRLKENGGNGSVCEHGEKGFQEAHTNHLSASSKLCSHIILCADPTLISKFSHTTSIPARPPKWLLESFRHQSIKSPDLYKCLSPRTVTNPSFTPTPRAGKRKYSDCTPEVPPSNTPSARKRVRTSPIGNRHDVAEVEAVKLLFPSPSRLPDVPSSRLVAIGSASKLAATRKMNWACEVRTSFGKCEVRMNDKICELLAVVQQSYVAKKDHFRAVGYQRAIAKIRSLEHDILTVQDVSSLGEQKSIGSKMERKVLEIVKTGRLQQAESVLNNVDYIAVKTLCDVWGIGPVKAMSLVSQGIKSIEQLRNVAKESPDLLDRNQTIGLKLYEDLLHRIPRNEVADLEMFVRKVVKSVDASLDITVAGSYLRGKESCGDVDILIYGSQDRLRKGFSNVKNALRKSGVLTDDLIDGHAKYFGVFKFAGRRHGRVDLFAVPDEQYPYALLTYTGSAIFNRSMRAKARALGYSLSHERLQRVHRGKFSKSRVEPAIHVKDEKEIFLLLDIPYVPPSARSIS